MRRIPLLFGVAWLDVEKEEDPEGEPVSDEDCLGGVGDDCDDEDWDDEDDRDGGPSPADPRPGSRAARHPRREHPWSFDCCSC